MTQTIIDGGAATVMTTKTIDRRKLYQRIAQDIERDILAGVFMPESRLPSEQELADRYGVSRNVIREASKTLQELGLIDIRTGSGSWVRRPTLKLVSDALHRFVRHGIQDFSITHFYEIRRMIEPDSAALAAERATDEDLRAIKAAFQAMESHMGDGDAWSRADLNFHRAVAAASYNPLVINIIDALIEPLQTVIAAGHKDPQGAKSGLEAHRRIVAALNARNAEAAHKAMLDHLHDSERRLSKIGFGNWANRS